SRDQARLAAGAGPVRDRRRVQVRQGEHRELGLPEGAGEAARQPDLARRIRVLDRLLDHALAGRPRAAADRRGGRALRCARYSRTSEPTVSRLELAREALHFCAAPEHLRRTVKIALAVGLVLTGINEGDILASGEATAATGVKIGLNFVVPFVVSNLGLLAGRPSNRSRDRLRPSA